MTFTDYIAACVHDELTLIRWAAESGSYGPTIARMAQRCEWWLTLAGEVEKRMSEAEESAEAIMDPALYLVPEEKDSGPQFELARVVTEADVNQLGWLRRDRALDAIHSLTKTESLPKADAVPS